MMHHPDNQHHCAINSIEYPVPPAHVAANALAQLGLGSASLWMPGEKREGIGEALHIGFANFLTKLCEAEFIDFNQIRFSSIRKFDFSHASHAAAR